ncbi:MAG: NUDIX hydrolase [Vulcanimicrobiota bacterium]
MEKTLTKTREFQGELLTLDVHQVELEDGSLSSREIVLHPDAVCCVVVTRELETVLVRQYRKAVEKPLLEIPAGKIDSGEDAARAAVRELREEVGFLDGKLEHLMDFYSSPGFCNEKLGLFLATEAVLGEQQLDEGEFIELVQIPLARAKQMALSGELGDAKSVAGILAAAGRLGL